MSPESAENAKYLPVTEANEIQMIIAELRSKATPLSGQTLDQHQFMFRTRLVGNDGLIHAEILPPAGRALKVGEDIQILFGLQEGLFVARTQVASASYDEASFSLGTTLFRLQRRNDFRTTLPPEYRIVFRLTSLKTSTENQGALLTPLDVSRGGMRLKWPSAKLARPAGGDSISGTLVLPGGKQIELFGLVRTIMAADATSFHVGIEFQNLSVRDEQTLLFTCVQIHDAQAAQKR